MGASLNLAMSEIHSIASKASKALLEYQLSSLSVSLSQYKLTKLNYDPQTTDALFSALSMLIWSTV